MQAAVQVIYEQISLRFQIVSRGFVFKMPIRGLVRNRRKHY